MSMSRKDYVKFAELFAGQMALAKNRADDTLRSELCREVQNIVYSTADIFAQDNPRFNRQKFYAASGL